MKKKNLINGFIPLNIQMFAGEENTAANGNEIEKETYTKEEYESLKKQLEKAKADKDKASKEAGDFRKQLRDKQTDEEKIAEERQQRENQYAQAIAENRKYKLTDVLAKENNFTHAEATQIAEVFVDENTSFEDIAKVLNDIVKGKLEGQKSTLMNEYKRGGRYPGETTKGGTTDNENSAELIAKRLGSNERTRASKSSKEKFGMYFGK